MWWVNKTYHPRTENYIIVVSSVFNCTSPCRRAQLCVSPHSALMPPRRQFENVPRLLNNITGDKSLLESLSSIPLSLTFRGRKTGQRVLALQQSVALLWANAWWVAVLSLFQGRHKLRASRSINPAWVSQRVAADPVLWSNRASSDEVEETTYSGKTNILQQTHPRGTDAL